MNNLFWIVKWFIPRLDKDWKIENIVSIWVINENCAIWGWSEKCPIIKEIIKTRTNNLLNIKK